MIYVFAVVENYDLIMKDNFEACVSYLTPMEPVARKKAKADSKKRIGGVVSAVLFDATLKKAKGYSGVELCLNKNRYFHQLSQS